MSREVAGARRAITTHRTLEYRHAASMQFQMFRHVTLTFRPERALSAEESVRHQLFILATVKSRAAVIKQQCRRVLQLLSLPRTYTSYTTCRLFVNNITGKNYSRITDLTDFSASEVTTIWRYTNVYITIIIIIIITSSKTANITLSGLR